MNHILLNVPYKFTKLHTILHPINFVFVRVFVLQSMNHIHLKDLFIAKLAYIGLIQITYHPLAGQTLTWSESLACETA